MDLLNYSQQEYNKILNKKNKLEVFKNLSPKTIPISALHGDNLTTKSTKMIWYSDYSLIRTISLIEEPNNHNRLSRYEIQNIDKSTKSKRVKVSGRVMSGSFKIGDIIQTRGEVQFTIEKISLAFENYQHRESPYSVDLTLKSRGKLEDGVGSPPVFLYKIDEKPSFSDEIPMILIFLNDFPLAEQTSFLIRFFTKKIEGEILKIDPKQSLSQFRIYKCLIKLKESIHFDHYRDNNETGSFLFYDDSDSNLQAIGLVK